MPEKYIIDVDTGVDDAQALMLALSRPDVEVIAITCVFGNVLLDQVCLNTLKVLTVWNRLDVPVYRGCSGPLVTGGLTATHYHGNDGLSDANLDIDVSLDQMQEENAVDAMIRLVNEHPGEITLVALAPLTNIALALKQDHDFGKKLKKVVIMGGNTQGRGNSTLCAEFNFANDPEAAFVVLGELNVPILMVPWEINLSSATGQSWEWFDQWIETDTKKGKFNKAITKSPVYRQRFVSKQSIYRSCDLNAMATVVDPSVITSTQDVFATVELNGTYTRGMMVVDWRNSLKKSPNVTLINSVNTDMTRKMFEDMIK
ncbi:hypothetical protein ACF0H5_007746 [Mactra antiquata]